MNRLIWLLAALPVLSFADGEYCKLHSEGPTKIVHIDNSPQWFAKVRTQGDYIYYIHQSDGNHMLSTTDKNDATRDFRIRGDIDPVPSPDGKILTVPGMEFYLYEDLIRDKENVRPFHTDPQLGGVYQSVAILKVDPQDSNKRTYRVVTDRGGSQIQYRDYDIDFNTSPPKLTPASPVTQHCPKRSVSTIMISKTGRLVTAFDLASNTTKIFDMTDMNPDTRCREVLDLGYGAGKIEFNVGTPRGPEVFNFDESDDRIVFHLDYFASNIGGYFPNGVEDNIVKNVYTMDLVVPQIRTGDWKLKTANIRNIVSGVTLGSGGYYPSFAGDKMIAVAYDDADSFSYRFYDIDVAKPYEFILPPQGPTFEDTWRNVQAPQNWIDRFHRGAVIGALWANECIPDEELTRKLTGVGATTYFLGLTKDYCRQLVETKWDELREQVINMAMWNRDMRFSSNLLQGLSGNQLLEVCNRIQPFAVAGEPEVLGTPSASSIQREHMLRHYCMGCHVTGASFTGVLGDVYPNMVNFKRNEDGSPKTNLNHLLSSRRRVKTGLEHQQSGSASRRPPDSMPPQNPVATTGTDFSHPEALQEMIENDIQTVMTMPARVPLWLRDEVQPRMSVADAAPAGVHIQVGAERVTRFSMPQVTVGGLHRQEFVLVNDSGQELTDLGANALNQRGLFYPGGLFPGEGGNCGSSLAARSSCRFVVGYSPSSRRQMYRATVAVSFIINGAQQVLELPIDGIVTALAAN